METSFYFNLSGDSSVARSTVPVSSPSIVNEKISTIFGSFDWDSSSLVSHSATPSPLIQTATLPPFLPENDCDYLKNEVAWWTHIDDQFSEEKNRSSAVANLKKLLEGYSTATINKALITKTLANYKEQFRQEEWLCSLSQSDKKVAEFCFIASLLRLFILKDEISLDACLQNRLSILEKIKDEYSEFIQISKLTSSEELTLFCRFERAARLLCQFFSSLVGCKACFLEVGRLLEGSYSIKYITGSGQTPCTERRVRLLEYLFEEPKVPRKRRGCKEGIMITNEKMGLRSSLEDSQESQQAKKAKTTSETTSVAMAALGYKSDENEDQTSEHFDEIEDLNLDVFDHPIVHNRSEYVRTLDPITPVKEVLVAEQQPSKISEAVDSLDLDSLQYSTYHWLDDYRR